jgi:hypothetical protein
LPTAAQFPGELHETAWTTAPVLVVEAFAGSGALPDDHVPEVSLASRPWPCPELSV